MSAKEAAEHLPGGGGAAWGERCHHSFPKWPHPESLATPLRRPGSLGSRELFFTQKLPENPK